MRRFALSIALAAALLSACAAATEGITIVVSSPGSIGVGPQRVLLAILDEETNQPRQTPEAAMTAVFVFNGEEAGRAPADWVWAIEPIRGFYIVNFDFTTAGNWTAHLESSSSTAPAEMLILADVAVVEIGEPAIASLTPTYPAFPLEAISTDPTPDPSFYSLSIADALASGRPTVIVFATPAFCTSAVCGPTLDLVKAAAPSHPGANFIHVEVFENLASPDSLTIAPSVVDWALPTEPWVFVADANGVVTARFEGTVGLVELERALTALGA